MLPKVIREGLTFDDVLLVPRRSEVLPKEVKLETYLTDKIKLNIPFLVRCDGYGDGVQDGDRHGA